MVRLGISARPGTNERIGPQRNGQGDPDKATFGRLEALGEQPLR